MSKSKSKSKSKQLAAILGDEALHRLSLDLDWLADATTGNEEIVVDANPHDGALYLGQTVCGVAQSLKVSRKALPRFVQSLQAAMARHGLKVTVTRCD